MDYGNRNRHCKGKRLVTGNINSVAIYRSTTIPTLSMVITVGSRIPVNCPALINSNRIEFSMIPRLEFSIGIRTPKARGIRLPILSFSIGYSSIAPLEEQNAVGHFVVRTKRPRFKKYVNNKKPLFPLLSQAFLARTQPTEPDDLHYRLLNEENLHLSIFNRRYSVYKPQLLNEDHQLCEYKLTNADPLRVKARLDTHEEVREKTTLRPEKRRPTARDQ